MKVFWMAAAKQDRAGIIDYIGRDTPRAAARMDALFTEAAAKWADFPEMGRPGKNRWHSRTDTAQELSAGVPNPRR